MRNLLEMSRLEAGTERRKPTLIEIGDVFNAALERVRPLLAPARTEVDIAPDLPPVPMDPVQIELVLSNLLENAAKYAPDTTSIVLSARQSGSELIVAVADRGPGFRLRPSGISLRSSTVWRHPNMDRPAPASAWPSAWSSSAPTVGASGR